MGTQHFQDLRKQNIERVHLIIKRATIKQQIISPEKLVAVCSFDFGISEKKVKEYIGYLKQLGLIIEDEFGIHDKDSLDQLQRAEEILKSKPAES